jgi:cysteine-S-conjugate beta-lyase
MNYDFDSRIDRTSSGCMKWNTWPGAIPMWVADMDFRSPPAIVEALRLRLDHGFFGYEDPEPPERATAAIVKRLKAAIVDWLSRHYGWLVKPQDVELLPGLVSGLNLACRAYGNVGDGVLMLTPAYPPFRRAPRNNGLVAHEIPLQRADSSEHVKYRIDFQALEDAVQPKNNVRTRMLMLCHPHNPLGLEFSREDRERLGQFCVSNDLVLCSDEIHCDLMLGGATHQPNAMLSSKIAERTVTLMSASKTFNLSGLGLGFAVVTNARLRERLRNAAEDITPPVNVLSATATLAAFSGQCDAWLEELRAYLTNNRDRLLETLKTRLPRLKATMPTATYLCWLDCKNAGIEGSAAKFFLKEAKVATSKGSDFGGDGASFIRLNFGCPLGQMMDALNAMAEAIGRFSTPARTG